MAAGLQTKSPDYNGHSPELESVCLINNIFSTNKSSQITNLVMVGVLLVVYLVCYWLIIEINIHVVGTAHAPN